MHALFLTALLIGDNPYRVVEANPFTVQVAPAKTDGFYIQWADGSYAYPGSSVLDRPQTSTVYVVGPWHNNREAIYATLSSPTRQQIEAALAQARQEWASAQRQVSRSAIPFVWPLPSAAADDEIGGDAVAAPWPKDLPFPEGFERYKRAQWTQAIAVVNNRDDIRPVHRSEVENKLWSVSGGLLGIDGWRSDLYRKLPSPPKTFVANIPVLNSFGYFQNNRGWKREYADGSAFIDALSMDGKTFEIRKREKIDGKWKASIIFQDEAARPAKFKGLETRCSECHSAGPEKGPGFGGYAKGIAPGGDTIFSDPFEELERER